MFCVLTSVALTPRPTMTTPIIMPKLGLTMEEGTLVQWLVSEGDRVVEGQAILEVETDKVTMEVEAPAAGTMGALLVREGQRVPITTVLAHIHPGDKPQEAGNEPVDPSVPHATEPETGSDVHPSQGAPGETPSDKTDRLPLPALQADSSTNLAAPGRTRLRSAGDAVRWRAFSSPRARKRAKEMSVDWRSLPGSGPRGRVVERDVLQAVEMSNARPGSAVEAAPVTIVGSNIFISAEVDLANLWDLHHEIRSHIERQAGAPLTLVDWLTRVVAVAVGRIRGHPQRSLSAAGQSPGVASAPSVAVGIMLSTVRGLPAALLPRASLHSLSQIVAARRTLETRAAARDTEADELAGICLLVADLSFKHVKAVLLPPTPPYIAVLTLGRNRPSLSERRPGSVSPNPYPAGVLSLTCGPQDLDASQALQLVEDVAELIEEPYLLLV